MLFHIFEDDILHNSDIKLQGINKLANGTRVRCATEEQTGHHRLID